MTQVTSAAVLTPTLTDPALSFQPEPMESGDATEAWTDLIDTYLPLAREIAVGIARKLPPWIDRESLIQSGVIGLLEAARRFDPQRGVEFRLYAGYRIRGEIMEYLRSLDVGTRAVRAWGRDLTAARHRCMIRHGREASAEEVATELGVPLQRYYQLDQRVSNAMMLSLADEAVAEAAEEALAHEARFPGPFLDPALVVESKDLIEKLAVITEQLSPRERLVVTLYYCEELTLQEIGEVLNLTEGRISQILSKTIVGLRQTLMTETCHPTSRQSSPHLPYNKKYARAEAPIA